MLSGGEAGEGLKDDSAVLAWMAGYYLGRQGRLRRNVFLERIKFHIGRAKFGIRWTQEHVTLDLRGDLQTRDTGMEVISLPTVLVSPCCAISFLWVLMFSCWDSLSQANLYSSFKFYPRIHLLKMPLLPAHSQVPVFTFIVVFSWHCLFIVSSEHEKLGVGPVYSKCSTNVSCYYYWWNW